MTLFDDYKNMHNELVNKKRTPELKQQLQKNIINYLYYQKNYLIKFMI